MKIHTILSSCRTDYRVTTCFQCIQEQAGYMQLLRMCDKDGLLFQILFADDLVLMVESMELQKEFEK